jgi:phosphoglycolate phosphatase
VQENQTPPIHHREYRPVNATRRRRLCMRLMRNRVIRPFSVYLFDIDGTLLDTAEDFCFAVQIVLSTKSRSDISAEFVKGYIGRPIRELFVHLFPTERPEAIEAMIQEYRMTYIKRDYPATRCYDSVADVLARLPGKKSTATTKATGTARDVLERFGLLPYFDHVQGTDGFPAKPNPDVIFKALEALRARPIDCLFVGDSVIDAQAAQNAGVRFCAVTYGYGNVAELEAFEPDYLIDRFRDLIPDDH